MTAFTAVPVLPVSNLDTALDYYLQVLGFTKSFQFEKYAGVEHGEVKLHLWEGARKPAGSAESSTTSSPRSRSPSSIRIPIRC